MAQKKELLSKLEKIEQAIVTQESLRDTLSDEQIDTYLDTLHQQKQVLLAKMEGSGALAQAAGAKAASPPYVHIGHSVTQLSRITNPFTLESYFERFLNPAISIET